MFCKLKGNQDVVISYCLRSLTWKGYPSTLRFIATQGASDLITTTLSWRPYCTVSGETDADSCSENSHTSASTSSGTSSAQRKKKRKSGWTRRRQSKFWDQVREPTPERWPSAWSSTRTLPSVTAPEPEPAPRLWLLGDKPQNLVVRKTFFELHTEEPSGERGMSPFIGGDPMTTPIWINNTGTLN